MQRRNPIDRLRSRISDAGRGSEERPLLRLAYRIIVGAEISAVRAAKQARRVRPVSLDNLTLVIKTFERPDLLLRLLKSTRRVFSGPIIIADDSQTQFVSNDPMVKVIALSFDSGVGAGRNALIDAVETECLWMADDDMVVLPDVDVRKPMDYLKRNPEVDLYGGRVIDLPRWRSVDYAGASLFAHTAPPKKRQGTIVDGLPVLYKVPNYYVARTASVREVRYDDRLKRVDHADFFTRAFGKLVCVYDSDWICLHAGSLFDTRYQAFRMDVSADSAYLVRKWRLGADSTDRTR